MDSFLVSIIDGNKQCELRGRKLSALLNDHHTTNTKTELRTIVSILRTIVSYLLLLLKQRHCSLKYGTPLVTA